MRPPKNVIVETRLLSNLRPTTRECVHLVTRGHFRSRDKDGGDIIRSAVSENPMLHASSMALSVMDPELWSIEVYIAGIGIHKDKDSYLFAPVTLTLTR